MALRNAAIAEGRVGRELELHETDLAKRALEGEQEDDASGATVLVEREPKVHTCVLGSAVSVAGAAGILVVAGPVEGVAQASDPTVAVRSAHLALRDTPPGVGVALLPLCAITVPRAFSTDGQ